MPHPKFILKTGSNGKWYFNLTAKNGQPILQSQGYVTNDGARNGIESVKSNAPKIERYEKLKSKNDQYYFNLLASNGQIIGTSEMYTTTQARDNGIASVMENAPNASIEEQ